MTPVDTRLLTPADAGALEAFLVRHRDTSMFLRANARDAGLVFRGGHGEAEYLGRFADGKLIGVAAHCWNGMLLLQCPEDTGELAKIVVAHSGRAVTGLSAPLEQVRAARKTLGLEDAATRMDGAERFYAVALSAVVIPSALANGTIECRPPRPEEYDTLRDWRYYYDVELLGAPPTDETRRQSTTFLDRQIAGGNAWVAVVEGRPVSLSAFNAALPDIVQLGGIYTPPPLRGRGYAKAVVAASLVAARDRRADRAVLFTDNPSAVRSYEAVGFKRAGDFSVVLFA
jgi:GNAT superfamily N-acetyltransferase